MYVHPNVQIEIIAAELGQSPHVMARWYNCDPEIDSDLAVIGVGRFLQLGAFSTGASIPSFRAWQDERDYWAGWLAREFLGAAEPNDALDWDPSRPLRQQWPWNGKAPDAVHGNADSTGTACTCGHAIEEHGNDPEYPGATACEECDCIAYESMDR